MNEASSAPLRFRNAAWPLGVLVAGVIIIGTLLATSVWGGGGNPAAGKVSAVLRTGSFFGAPYLLCAVGLWLCRDRRLRWFLRVPSVIVVAVGLLVAEGALAEVLRAPENAIWAHMLAAAYGLMVQYPLSMIVALLGVIGWFYAPLRVTPNDSAW